MDANNITMLFRYGSHVAVKIAFPTMKYDVLVDFVCRKWNFMERQRIMFAYHINQVGEYYINEDNDIQAMFVLLRRYEIEQIEVQIDLPEVSRQILHEFNGNNSS